MHRSSFSHIDKKRHIHEVYLLFSLVFILFGCSQKTECPKQECPVCPASSPHVSQNHVQLSQLDAESRDRLKTEILAEIKDEMKAEWMKEFETEMAKNKPETKPEVIETEPEPRKPIAVPAHLPPTQKIERDAGGMKILRHTFATRIDHRLPADERDAFSISDGSVYCYVEISAADEEDRMITIKFTHSTGLAQSYSLPVSQSPAWRTWSKLNLTKSMTGTWLCEIFNEDNVLLASRPFVVVD